MESNDGSMITHTSEIVNSETKFVELKGQKFAYRSYGLPLILLNRFRGTLDTSFIGGLAETFNVIIIDYSGIGLSTGKCSSDVISMADDVKAFAEALKC